MKNWKFLMMLTAMLGGLGTLSADEAAEEPATEEVADAETQQEQVTEEVADAAE